MTVRNAYYVITLAISLAVFAYAYAAAAAKAATVCTIATAVSLGAFAESFLLGERTRYKAVD